MTYTPTDTDNDGVVDVPVDNESVDTETVQADGESGEDPDQAATGAFRTGDATTSYTGFAAVFQPLDDTATNGEGKAHALWRSANGENMTAMTSHATHEHHSIYSREGSLDGSEGSLAKRLDIGFGASTVPVDWHGFSQFTYNGAEAIRHVSGGNAIIYRDAEMAFSDLGQGDVLRLVPGNYNPQTISVSGVTVVGGGRSATDGTTFDASDGVGLTITSDNVTVKDMSVQSSGTDNAGILFQGAFGGVVQNATLGSTTGEHIVVDTNSSACILTNMARASGAGAANSIDLQGDDNIVDNYTNGGTVNDGGTNNVIGNTT